MQLQPGSGLISPVSVSYDVGSYVSQLSDIKYKKSKTKTTPKHQNHDDHPPALVNKYYELVRELLQTSL